MNLRAQPGKQHHGGTVCDLAAVARRRAATSLEGLRPDPKAGLPCQATGFNLAKLSLVVPARGPSSCSTTTFFTLPS